MPLNIPPGFGNCRFVFQCSGIVDEMGFSLGIVPPGGTTAVDAAQEMSNFFNGQIWDSGAAASVDYTWLRTEVTLMTTEGALIGVDAINGAGVAAPAVAAANLAIIIQKVTAVGGRKNKGRLFMPAGFIPETQVNSAGVLLPLFAAARGTEWNTMLGEMITNGYSAQLYHTDPADEPTQITGFVALSLCGTQRRRMR